MLLRSLAPLLLLMALVPNLTTAQTPAINSGGVVMAGSGSSSLVYGNWWEIYGSNLSTCTQGPSSSICSEVTTSLTDYYFIYDCWGPYPTNCNVYTWAESTLRDYNSSNSEPSWWYESASQVNFFPKVAYAPTPAACAYYGSICDGPFGFVDSLKVCNSLGNCSASYPYDASPR
jgi:hypothetical protein